MGKPYPAVQYNPALIDIEHRLRLMDRYDDYVQVLTPGGPPLEVVAEPSKAVELAKLQNDCLAELVFQYPDRFIAAVAIIPLGDIEMALNEIDRAVNELKFRGILIYTPQYVREPGAPEIKGTRALDSADFIPVYEKMVKYNLPIWIHPMTTDIYADYTTESVSRYRIWQIFGWPYHSSAAMTRLVFSGILERFPSIKFIIHHAGALVPFFDRRIAAQYDYEEMCYNKKDKQGLTKSPIEYFRMFYVDTAVSGSVPALMCAYSFYGAGKMLFGTDVPHDCQRGVLSLKDTIRSIEEMSIPDSEKKMIFEDNARSLMRLPV